MSKLIRKFDLITLGALATLVKGGEVDSKYIRRIYMVPSYMRMCCRNLKDNGKLDKELFTECMKILKTIKTRMTERELTFGQGQLEVYALLEDTAVSAEVVRILEGAMRLYMFGDPLFENVVPDKVEAAAEKHEVTYQRKLLARQFEL